MDISAIKIALYWNELHPKKLQNTKIHSDVVYIGLANSAINILKHKKQLKGLNTEILFRTCEGDENMTEMIMKIIFLKVFPVTH